MKEGGKPLKWATVEATGAVSTFRWAAEEIAALGRRAQRLDTERRWVRGRPHPALPVGPVLGITPFNFPLNLVAHKVAPALAVGAPIVVKPASATPLGALSLGGVHRRDGPTRGHVSGPSGGLEGRRRHG